MNEVDRWYHSCQILLVREWQANCRVWVWPLYTDNKWCIIAHDKIEGENQAEFKGETFFLDNTLHYICIIYTVACQLAISFCHAINPTWAPPIVNTNQNEGANSGHGLRLYFADLAIDKLDLFMHYLLLTTNAHIIFSVPPTWKSFRTLLAENSLIWI